MKSLDRSIDMLHAHIATLKRNIKSLTEGIVLTRKNLSDMKNSQVVSMAVFARTQQDLAAYTAALARHAAGLEISSKKLQEAIEESASVEAESVRNNVIPFRRKE